MITIQKANIDDAIEIKELLRETWNSTYADILSPDEIEKVTSEWHSLKLLRKQIKNPKVLFLVVKLGDELIALCNTSIMKGDHINIQRLYVRPGYQGQGIGSKLIKEVSIRFPKCRKIDLEVEEQNDRAIAFYQKQGFKKVGKKVLNVASVRMPSFVMEKNM